MLKLIIKKILYRIRAEYTTEQLISMGMNVGSNFKRLHGVILDPSHCWLISIGNNVTLAPRVHILAHDASTCNSIGYAKIGRVVIGNNVFVGASSVILPNTVIGNNVIIGANSTISKNIPDNSVYAGNPAKFICSYKEYVFKHKKKFLSAPVYGEDYTVRGRITTTKKLRMISSLDEKGIGYVK